jgi:light-regulated signal transduction histidine kinase (bacteriophytochrome)
MTPSLFPVFDSTDDKLHDGTVVEASSFCHKAIGTKPECLRHYDSLKSKPEGYYQCPFGLTTRSFYYAQKLSCITGVVAFPRFDTAQEREMAKRYPEIKVARSDIEGIVKFFRDLDRARADSVQEAAKVLPQAFHELRKLNGAILQHAEKEMKEAGESRALVSIRSAAELMRNNFDILEALSNIEGMKVLPIDATINLYDLVYKTKCVLEERATSRELQMYLGGVRAIIRGSQKSFPIVPAVLLENAIKFAKRRTAIRADVVAQNDKAILSVENETIHFIDSTRCFDRGVRFPTGVEGGGFGLFLAREIVFTHNGTIRCEYANGRVRMIVELPLVDVIPQKS